MFVDSMDASCRFGPAVSSSLDTILAGSATRPSVVVEVSPWKRPSVPIVGDWHLVVVVPWRYLLVGPNLGIEDLVSLSQPLTIVVRWHVPPCWRC